MPLKYLRSNVSNFVNSFSTSKCYVSFEVIFLLKLDSLASKSVFVIKFAYANLAAKFSAANLLNSGVVIYLSCLWAVSFFSSSLIFVSYSVFLTKLLAIGISFSTADNAEVVTKPPILGILFSNSLILTL